MRYSIKSFFSLFLLLCCVSGISYAQEEQDFADDYAEIWFDYTLGKSLNDKWSFGGDGGYRTGVNNVKWRLLYLRPNVTYKALPYLNVTVGIGSFNTFINDLDNIYEFRIYQDGNFSGPRLGPIMMLHRIRLEQRFFNFGDSIDDDGFSFRGRYMLALNSDKFRLGGEKDWSGFMSLEPFFPLGNDVSELLANNFRWDSALAYHFSDTLRMEVHYIFQTSEIFSNNNARVVEHIFRVRVFQKF